MDADEVERAMSYTSPLSGRQDRYELHELIGKGQVEGSFTLPSLTERGQVLWQGLPGCSKGNKAELRDQGVY
jgi:hypothetical protein